jgi:hypothetical protein
LEAVELWLEAGEASAVAEKESRVLELAL